MLTDALDRDVIRAPVFCARQSITERDRESHRGLERVFGAPHLRERQPRPIAEHREAGLRRDAKVVLGFEHCQPWSTQFRDERVRIGGTQKVSTLIANCMLDFHEMRERIGDMLKDIKTDGIIEASCRNRS
jgi:hypothetical protein